MEHNMAMGLRISLLDRAFKYEMDLRLKEHGLTGVQIGVLGQLIHLEDAGKKEINQRALEKAARVTHPTMTEILKRLERGGFIRCESSSSDKRSKNIFTTEKARGLRSQIIEIDREVSLWFCREMSEEQRKAFIEITDIMLKNACCHGKDRKNEDT